MNRIAAGPYVALPDERDPSARGPTPAVSELTTEIKAASELTASGENAPSRQLSSITSRTDLRIAATAELAMADPDRKGVATVALDQETARQWATLDATEFGRMRSEERKTTALDAIAGNIRASPDYAEAMEKRSPNLASAGKAINDEVEKHQLARDVELAAARRRGDLESRREKTLAAIDANALSSVTKIRAEQVAEVTARLRHDPDPVLGRVDINEAQLGLGATTERKLGDNSIPLSAGADRSALEAEKRRVIKRPIQESELPQAIRSRFIVSAQKDRLFEAGKTEFAFRSGNRQGELAFSDSGKQLVTASESRETIVAMLEVAKAKNWREITVSGTDEFRRQAWLEARLAGMEVRGFEPKDADRQLLQELQSTRGGENRIVVADRNQTVASELTAEQLARQKGPHINVDDLSANERAGMQQASALLQSRAMSAKFSAATLAELEKRVRGERVYVGTVVDFGAAPYQFKKEKDPSYFITLKTMAEERTIWGKDLKQAVVDGHVKKGDDIVLRNSGAREVTVKEKVLDAAGTPIGTREKPAKLNQWTAEPLARYNQQTLNARDNPPPVREQASAPPAIRPPSRDR